MDHRKYKKTEFNHKIHNISLKSSAFHFKKDKDNINKDVTS